MRAGSQVLKDGSFPVFINQQSKRTGFARSLYQTHRRYPGAFCQDIPADTIGSKGRLHHRAGSSSRYRRPGVEDITGDGAKSVESRLCQDRHASPKRTSRVAFASRVTDSRYTQISRRKWRANSLSVFKPRASGIAGPTGLFPVRGDGHPSGITPHRNRRHHHVGGRVDHRDSVVDFICDALEGACTRRACSLVRSSLPPGDAKTSNRANGGRLLPLGNANARRRDGEPRDQRANGRRT